MCGARPVVLETRAEDGYVINAESLRACLKANPKVKSIILCNPSNPTGGVAERSDLEKMAAVMTEYPSVVVLADEIYEQLTYDTKHVSFASLPGMFDRTVTVNGFSKSHSMTGFATLLFCSYCTILYYASQQLYQDIVLDTPLLPLI